LEISAFVDASPLISFLKIARFDLLEIVGKPLACTDFVAAEVKRPRQAFEEVIAQDRITEIPVTDPALLLEVEQLYERGLGRGEASSILLAEAHKCSLIIDDKNARKIAKKKKIPLHSTAEIIVQNIQSNVLTLDEADGFISEWLLLGEFPVSVKTFKTLIP